MDPEGTDDVAPVDDLELDVRAVVAGGAGLARDADGRVVFVAGALPGERVRARVTGRRRDFARAEIAAVLVPAAARVEPPCPFVPAGCGGCDWQHVDPTAQAGLKAAVVADALRRQAGLDLVVEPGPSLAPTGYRTTLRGVARGGRFGFRRRGSHDVVAVDPCLIAHPVLADLVAEGRFPDGEIVLRGGAGTGERLVVVAGPAEAASVPDGVRVVSAAELAAGRRAWFHEEVAGRRWRISARSFFQARPDGADVLVAEVGRALAGVDLEAGVADLYGGVGLFAGALGTSGPVTLVEHSASAVADARVNLADRGAKVVRADVARWRPRRAAAVVADPPRTGLGRPGVAVVAATGASRVVLVSCDPAAFARDARLLAEAGYQLRHATLVDLFPMTSHVEVVARFDAPADGART